MLLLVDKQGGGSHCLKFMKKHDFIYLIPRLTWPGSGCGALLFAIMIGPTRAVFHGWSMGSSKVSLGPIMPYHSIPYGQPTPVQPKRYPGVGYHKVNVIIYSKDPP